MSASIDRGLHHKGANGLDGSWFTQAHDDSRTNDYRGPYSGEETGPYLLVLRGNMMTDEIFGSSIRAHWVMALAPSKTRLWADETNVNLGKQQYASP